MIAELDPGGRTLAPALAMRLMLGWYRTEHFEDADPDGGDMLLFEWGTYDWGRGEWFRYGIRRQLIGPHEPDDADSAIWQLAVGFRYPADGTQPMGRGGRWCEDRPQLDAFETFIQVCPATEYVVDRSPAHIEITFEVAG